MIFLTVGSQFPFDRLVTAVDEAVGDGIIEEEIYAQIGESEYKPRNFKYVERLGKNEYDKLIKTAGGIISHAGMGTISTALEHSKPLLAMPRLKRYGEVVNDHQVDIAEKFSQAGLILTAYTAEEVAVNIRRLGSFVPAKRQNQAEMVIKRISEFLSSFAEAKEERFYD